MIWHGARVKVLWSSYTPRSGSSSRCRRRWNGSWSDGSRLEKFPSSTCRARPVGLNSPAAPPRSYRSWAASRQINRRMEPRGVSTGGRRVALKIQRRSEITWRSWTRTLERALHLHLHPNSCQSAAVTPPPEAASGGPGGLPQLLLSYTDTY